MPHELRAERTRPGCGGEAADFCCLDGTRVNPSGGHEADPVDSDLEHRLARIPEFGNCVLRAIINGKEKPPLAVTASFDQKGTIP